MARITYRQKQAWQIGKAAGVAIFAIILTIGALTGMFWFARPSVSALENRNLTEFPAFSWNGLWDGSWFSQASLWYADTYPGRETLVARANALKNLYGIQSSSQMIGGKSSADAIPEDGKAASITPRTEIPDNYDVRQDVMDQIMEGELIQNGSAYGIYYYVDEAAQGYIQALNQAAEQLKGTTQVYSLLIPNNSGVMLDEQTLAGTGGSNQSQAIDYYFTQYNDAITPVPVIERLIEHNDEYLYFHSDHHWTALAAYYAYLDFCKAKELEPEVLEDLETYTFEPFEGSYRTISDSLLSDSVTGYVPRSTNTSKVFTSDTDIVPLDLTSDSYYEGNVFSTDKGVDEYSQYLRFINGDQGLEEIDNPEISDGTTCVVVKESYGNALVPFLVDHYDKVYVIDYRYADGNILDFCRENEIDDLIFANNIQIIGNINIVNTIASMLESADAASQTDSDAQIQDPDAAQEAADEEI